MIYTATPFGLLCGSVVSTSHSQNTGKCPDNGNAEKQAKPLKEELDPWVNPLQILQSTGNSLSLTNPEEYLWKIH